MAKRILAVRLAAVLPLSLAACSGNTETSGTGSDSSAAGESGTEGTGETDLREPELVTLDIVTMASGKEDSGVTQVEEAMNEILEEQFNVNVNLTFLPFGSYADQTTLMLSSGEGVDLIAVYMISYASCATSGQIMPIDDLLEEYGQGIIDELGWDMINCGRVDGELYGLTQGRDLAASEGFAYRLDLAEELGLDMESVKTIEDLEEVLKTVKENTENVWPVAVSAGENIRNWGWDALGDEMVNLGVLPDMAQDTTVVNL